MLWLKLLVPLWDSSTICHSRKQHTAAGNINPASFISSTTRKLKDLSLSLSSFHSLSYPNTHTHLFFFLPRLCFSLTCAQKPQRRPIDILYLFLSILECTFIKRLNQDRYHDSVYCSMQQIHRSITDILNSLIIQAKGRTGSFLKVF